MPNEAPEAKTKNYVLLDLPKNGTKVKVTKGSLADVWIVWAKSFLLVQHIPLRFL